MYELDWSSIPGALPFLWQGMKVSLAITAVAVGSSSSFPRSCGTCWG